MHGQTRGTASHIWDILGNLFQHVSIGKIFDTGDQEEDSEAPAEINVDEGGFDMDD